MVASFVALVLLGGCDAAIERFPENELHAHVVARREALESDDLKTVRAELTAALELLFGTPDEPRWPAGLPDRLVDPDHLVRAAGAVWNDKEGINYGLYRAHCVVCHGLDGSGTGPAAALQNPYPRDFRPGVFKYKSTPRGEKPTRDDLRHLLRRGIPGTGMPSFALLPPEDLEALVDYTIYLAVRGQTERRALEMAAWDEQLSFAGESAAAHRLAADVASSWAEARPAAVPDAPAGWEDHLQEAAVRGRALFHGPLVNCAACHGQDGRGDAITFDYDDWTKQYTTRLGIAPNASAVKSMRQLGALRPRLISPRNLSWGVYRGGDDPRTLYRLVMHGIDGTPMPAALIRRSPESVGLTSDDVWDLVAYLLVLQRG